MYLRADVEVRGSNDSGEVVSRHLVKLFTGCH